MVAWCHRLPYYTDQQVSFTQHAMAHFETAATQVRQSAAVLNVRLGSHGSLFTIMQSYMYNWIWHTTTLAYGHTTIAISCPWGECTYIMQRIAYLTMLSPPGSIYMVQSIEVVITFEGPRLDINPWTSSPQDMHANHFTDGDRYAVSCMRSSWDAHFYSFSGGFDGILILDRIQNVYHCGRIKLDCMPLCNWYWE